MRLPSFLPSVNSVVAESTFLMEKVVDSAVVVIVVVVILGVSLVVIGVLVLLEVVVVVLVEVVTADVVFVSVTEAASVLSGEVSPLLRGACWLTVSDSVEDVTGLIV